jgi:hypothetical protein
MSESLISLLYTTARPHIIEAVIDRWLRDDLVKTEMIVVTDDPYLPSKNRGNVNYVKNNGRRDCVTGWNLAAQNSVGDILIQVSDDLFHQKIGILKFENYYQNYEKLRTDRISFLIYWMSVVYKTPSFIRFSRGHRTKK